MSKKLKLCPKSQMYVRKLWPHVCQDKEQHNNVLYVIFQYYLSI